ncbi:O-antigen ligase family protein [Aquimarina sp. TRL1]|uniref:O-antigen ligase family protein n=1 Tax=Aquimarina sp. (strain TRL1) TaxID=2736252 RepID=UPI00158CEECD|nr:O-antigen ligase family protein [Aquimarina sp. TRL1]QKX04721.1 O-antigen ligase family protein [Aquimarina sp. TRL1]
MKELISNISNFFYRDEDKNWILTIFWNSLYIAFFLLPLGIKLPTPFFVLAIVLGVLHIFKSKKEFITDNKALLLFPLYFVVLTLGLLYTDNIYDGIKLLQRSLSLLLFPIIFLFVKEDASAVRKLFEFLLVGLLFSFFINLALGIQSTLEAIKRGIIIETIDSIELLETVITGWDFFIREEFSRLVNSNYVSIYILLVLSFYLKRKLASRLQLLIILILFTYLFLLASKWAYLALTIISLILIFNIGDRNRRYTMFVIFFLAVLVFVDNPRMSVFYNRVRNFTNIESYEAMSSEKSRLLIWDACIKLIGESPFLGYGTGDANDILLREYATLGYEHNLKRKYNAHNQFFQTWLQTGVLGFIVLAAIFVILGRRMRRSPNELAVFLILLISLLFESMLVRFNGIVFFSIIIPLLLKKRSILSSRIIRNEPILGNNSK